MNIVATVKDRLAEALKLKEWGAADLVRECNKLFPDVNADLSTFCKYINGTRIPKRDKIYMMAQALNVSEIWLMGMDVSITRYEYTPDASDLAMTYSFLNDTRKLKLLAYAQQLEDEQDKENREKAGIK